MSKERFERMMSLNQFNTNMECPGCGKSYRGLMQSNGRVMMEFEFYVHVIQKCKFAKQNVKQCAKCGEKFHQLRGLRVHFDKTGHHRSRKVRDWVKKSQNRMNLRRRSQNVTYAEE